jgi:hypothetical protein
VERRGNYTKRKPQRAKVARQPQLERIEEEEEDEVARQPQLQRIEADDKDGAVAEVRNIAFEREKLPAYVDGAYGMRPGVPTSCFQNEIQREGAELNRCIGNSHKWQIRDFDPPAVDEPFVTKRVKMTIPNRSPPCDVSNSTQPSYSLFRAASTFAETPRSSPSITGYTKTYTAASTLVDASSNALSLTTARFSTIARDSKTIRTGEPVPPATTSQAPSPGCRSEGYPRNVEHSNQRSSPFVRMIGRRDTPGTQ